MKIRILNLEPACSAMRSIAGRYRMWGIFLVSIFLFTPFLLVHAATISPVRQTAVVDPGKSEVADVYILNDSRENQVFFPEVSPFIIDEKTGGALFDQKDLAVGWFEITPKQLSLAPGKAGSFSFSVSIPDGAEPGAHYFGLFARQEPKAGQIGIESRMASLFFLHVSGLVQEDLIRNYFTSKLNWYFQNNIFLKSQFKNVGNIHVIPNGEMIVKNMFGKEIQRIDLNPDQQKVLPQGLWNQDYFVENLSWKDSGRVQAKIHVEYGLSQKNIVDTVSFWYVPIWLLGVLFVLLCTIIGFVFLFSRKKKK